MLRFRLVLVRCLLLIGLIAAGSPGASAQTLIDDFAGPALDPAWDFPAVDVLGSTSGAVPSYDFAANPGKLTYTFTPHTGEENPAAQYGLYRDDFSLANDGDYVQITVNFAETVGAPLQNFAGLSLNATTTVPFDRTDNYTMYARADGRIDVVKGNSIVGSTGLNLYGGGQDVVLRFTRIDATHVHSSYSLDGGFAFTSMPQIAGNDNVITGFSAIGIYAGNNRKQEAGSVYLFDNLVFGNINLENPGDFNDDGVVDAADYLVWRNSLDSDVDLPNDGILTGPVGINHYKMWKANYTGSAPQGALLVMAQSVPEPGTLVSLGLAIGLVAGMSRRFRFLGK